VAAVLVAVADREAAMVRIVVYGGLLESPNMHGLRPLIEEFADAVGYTSEFRDWKDDKPIEPDDTLILIGHSYGGHQTLTMAETLPKVDLLIALDPVYQDGNPDDLEVFGVPHSVKCARCWWRGHVFRLEVSWPLLEEDDRDIVNVQRPDIGHSGWAQDEDVRQGILTAIARAVAGASA
jgi:pimeloyl-ACP methyl ester carboxylesterase